MRPAAGLDSCQTAASRQASSSRALASRLDAVAGQGVTIATTSGKSERYGTARPQGQLSGPGRPRPSALQGCASALEGPCLRCESRHRHCPPEKFIEQRHGECGIAVGGTVDHSLRDQPASTGSRRLHFEVELRRYVAGTMRTRAKLCHSPQVPLLRWRQPVEPHPEEVRIQVCHHTRTDSIHHLQLNRAAVCLVPDMVSPLLEEVRIAAGSANDRVERLVGKSHPLLDGWDLDGVPSIAAAKAVNERELKQALGIGFNRAGEARQLRKPGTHQDNRKVPLPATRATQVSPSAARQAARAAPPA